ncbi:MAG: site-specific DNA-methyltransferase [Gammaproteobacteria bacterium]
MARKKTGSGPAKGKKIARDYRHEDRALLRPESGAQDVFPAGKHKSPTKLRYDSSLAPELAWDESDARGEGEQLIETILSADTLESAQAAGRQLKSLSKSFLDWAGKAERGGFTVPTLPLFTHERLSTHAVLETLKRRHPRRNETLELFGEGDKSIGDKIRGAYEHQNGWQNRMILGDSLQVMNSLLQYEGLGGQVQMIYMDPPYGIKFGSNFQPFVRKRTVREGDDDSLSREPEMVQAYRDTWELGTHSWLTYMRDRLLLARELLTDSGSCFVQISDENVHHVREIMDEVFGSENFVSNLGYRTKSPLGTKYVGNAFDFIIWYAKNINSMKFRSVFVEKTPETNKEFSLLECDDGSIRLLSTSEKTTNKIPAGSKIFSSQSVTSSGRTPSCVFDFEFQTMSFFPGGEKSWSTNRQGMDTLARNSRLYISGKSLRYKYYLKDFPVKKLSNLWADTYSEPSKSYVVQTASKVIQRCMLMTTDPGDLVFDPTCGSGTTAYVAEQWGRRWITTDVSRVPLALVRERLLTATYPYYKLQDEQRGPAGGFAYERKQNRKGEEVGGIVPHVTLRSIANNEAPTEEVLVDKPEIENKVVRITGPFCVESILPTPMSPDMYQDNQEVHETHKQGDASDHIGRMIEVLRLSPEIKLSGNKTFKLKNVRPPANALDIHAEVDGVGTDANDSEHIAVVFGPENGPISERVIINAGKEASHKQYTRLLVIAFAIEPAARETVEKAEATFGIPAIYVQATTDLVMSDLLKNTRSSQIFAVVGLPDVKLKKTGEQEEGEDLWEVTLQGLDTFDPATMEHIALRGDDVPCWMLDIDYDGYCFRAGQIFFPRTSAWNKIRQAVSADFDDAVWDALRGNVSAPFIAGEQIAVKVLDDRGNELLVVKKLSDVK